MSELSDKEKKISKLAIWVWRNLLASGVFLVCFGFLYNKLSTIEHDVIEVKTVVKERIRVDRGDYGWAEPAYAAPSMTDEEYEKLLDEGIKIREHINSFADEVQK